MADDKPEFTQRQRAHAADIKAQRATMDLFGVSRSQARHINARMAEFQQRQMQTQTQAQTAPTPLPTFDAKNSTFSFAPSQLSLDDKGRGGVPLPDGELGDILYHNGITWVALNKPASTMILQNTSVGIVSWVTAPTGLPAGTTGDMLYYNGSAWVALSAPTVADFDPVLRHNGTAPYWDEPEEC